ncbi:MAG: type III pantothenate kinase [Clostridia bacterium]|nr:type III pantothenate kinase [Clostridia bacterium]MBR6754500.1 type III pantothenate kinase [Clostridia bacterium]
MILAIDIGNTNIALGGFVSDELRFVSRISSNAKTDDEFALRILESLSLHQIDRSDIAGVIISSVVPPLNTAIKNAIRFVFKKEPVFVGPGIKSGISIKCDIPSSVGADLISASVAVSNIYGSPALIIDIGTATKMTVLDNKGAFIGTSIIPGVMMGLDALAEGTAQLPKISLEVPDTVIAKNTADCMRSGVLFGNASLIDGMIERINEEFGEELNIYATGGMSKVIIPLCKHKITVDEHLVLKGLNILYRKNKN